jgi:hypothetical protein
MHGSVLGVSGSSIAPLRAEPTPAHTVALDLDERHPLPSNPPPRPPQALYLHADLVLPCNSSFNAAWERHLGAPRARLMALPNAVDGGRYPCLQVG